MTTRPHPIPYLAPGVALCGAVTAAAYALQHGEQRLFGHAWLEALVLAIVVGTTVRSLWTPDPRWFPGIAFSAKFLLELAVVLLGASISVRTIMAAGPWLLIGIAGTVATAIACSFAIGKLLRLPTRMALLIACGNSICGNSAIAAVAPVIGADGEDVAASIGFTAVLGVAVVLGLPLLGVALGMSGLQYGALAGLTVYAVPQVLAAAAPIGPAAVQMGTLVKLVRVLMLGPVVAVLAMLHRQETGATAARAGFRLIPGFIVVFLALAGLRGAGLVSDAWAAHAHDASLALTVVAMAGLGLRVDLRSVASAGPRVTASVIGSLAVLFVGALAVIAWG